MTGAFLRAVAISAGLVVGAVGGVALLVLFGTAVEEAADAWECARSTS